MWKGREKATKIWISWEQKELFRWNNFAGRAEKEQNIALIIKSDGLRNSVKENKKELEYPFQYITVPPQFFIFRSRNIPTDHPFPSFLEKN